MRGRARTYTWPEGATWIGIFTITNAAGAAGAHFYSIRGVAGSEYRLMYGEMFNGDTVAVAMQMIITDGSDSASAAAAQTDIVAHVTPNNNLAAGVFRSFPTANVSADSGPMGWGWPMVSGTMRLKCETGSVAVSQDTQLAVALRLWNAAALPTVTLTGGASAVTATVRNQVF